MIWLATMRVDTKTHSLRQNAFPRVIQCSTERGGCPYQLGFLRISAAQPPPRAIYPSSSGQGFNPSANPHPPTKLIT
ncbi:hypothetical protein GFS31_13990 [Leptolyngbya sp. BL0902]|nr:hypothetical protein GFS31_13990 [Leptolyngbya sp. BL0902]